MMNFNLTLSGEHFSCSSILNDSFDGQSNLGCRSLPFMTWNTSFQSVLACKVSFEKSADSLMGTPFQVTVSFSLAAFKIVSLSLILGNLMMMCLGVFLFGSNFFGTLGFLDFLEVYFLHEIGEVFLHYLLTQFLISCSSSSPSGTPIIRIFKVVPEFPKPLLIFLNSYFFILCPLEVYFFVFVTSR